MKAFTVPLYEHFGYLRPQGAAGLLRCCIPDSGQQMAPGRRHPGILVLPGGGYNHVSVREGEPVALRFLNRGYCAFVLEYSVAPLGYPTALREAAMAMRYIRENADSLCVHPNMIAAVGFSAGGHLCGCLGTLFDDAVLADIGPAGLLRPDGLGLCYPVTVSWGPTHEGTFRSLCGTDAELRQRLSLDYLVRPDMPPVFLWHTRDDPSVPCRNSLILAGILAESGVDFALHIYRTGKHGLSTADAQVYPAGEIPAVSWDVPLWPEAMQGFLEEKGFQITDRGEDV